jgi:integrase
MAQVQTDCITGPPVSECVAKYLARCWDHGLLAAPTSDTFAVRALLRGMQLEDVSRLLGHASVKVTETYDAKWVGSRKRRLERLVAESLLTA